jgi:dienelactone hydrolase
MHTEDIEYHLGDKSLLGHLAVDDERAGPRPAVLVCHEGPGLDDHAKSRAVRLAELGYVAFALDYHGGGKPLAMADMMPAIGALMGDPDHTRALGQAGLDVLLAQDQTDPARVAAIGYCFGGTLALELARSGADLKAVVGFHSGLGTSRPEDAGNIKASVLVCIGSEDPMVGSEARAAFEQEMRAADVDWRLYLFGGAVHSFTNPLADSAGIPGIAFHGPTDERTWRAMLDFFDEQFGPV